MPQANTSGTISWYNGGSGTFTVYDERPTSNFSSPTSIAYKTFTDNSSKKSLTFGSQSGSSVSVATDNWSAMTYNTSNTFDVTYTVNSTKEASLIVVHKTTEVIGSFTQTETWNYTLTFTSATGGNYSYLVSSSNRYVKDKSGSGTFTLK